jgi:predicted nucleic acid-binding protein
MNWYFDTSVLVPAAVSHHPHNSPSLAVLEKMVSRKHSGFFSAHSLAEFYSVMTRTPFKPPVYPSEVLQIIEAMILPHLQLVTLDAKEYEAIVRHCAGKGWTGGRIHDAVHLQCAEKAKCDRIYTFNVKDFKALAPAELQDKIVAP